MKEFKLNNKQKYNQVLKHLKVTLILWLKMQKVPEEGK
jgi:hypothetical protein